MVSLIARKILKNIGMLCYIIYMKNKRQINDDDDFFTIKYS